MTVDEQIDAIKRTDFESLRTSACVWMIEERDGQFTVRQWTGAGYKFGAGVSPAHDYPTLRKAAARLLQLLGTGPVAPQAWPEDVCIGTVTLASADDGNAEPRPEQG